MKKAVTYRLDQEVLEMVQKIVQLQQEQLKQDYPHINSKVYATDIVSQAIKKEYEYWTGKSTL